ncbi:MAG: MBL fold metallo-hydrolase, partial [Bacteroidota bacterium]
MKISFLGTGTSQGVPVIACDCETCLSEDPRDKRLRTSLLVQSSSTSLVIDTGPDFRQQMLNHKVRKLDAVLFTHEHRDHIAGLDDIRAFNFRQKRAMDIYTEERVLNALQYQYPYIFAEKKYPGAPQVNIHLINTGEFKIGELNIIPVRVMHYRLPVLGFRIGDLAYITDANYISEEEKEKLYGVKYFIINALRREQHISHFTLTEALELINEISPKRAYLTHISHLMGRQQQLEKELPKSVQAAYDG